MNTVSRLTYIWMDGTKPTQKLRCKVKIIPTPEEGFSVGNIPHWGFDGSSTYQADGHHSDLVLVPVYTIPDPMGDVQDQLVMCEVMNPDGTPHATNTRAKLREMMDKYGEKYDPWIGFEQEYTLFKGARPLGWPDGGYPAPQGPFYCGIGADEVFGRDLIEDHTQACIDAGLMIAGTNAEVMPGQWEFQIGYRHVDSESADPLTISDHLWLARWLLYRLAEEYEITVTLDPKPVRGDWNGAGKHTNFSTKAMRTKSTGMAAIEDAIAKLEKTHDKHIKLYGAGLETRLTGLHETQHIDVFTSGVADRGASIRIPQSVAAEGYGYLEDRRPGANADPYVVSAAILETICE